MRSFPAICILAIGLASAATKEDSGWVSVFNGKDFNDFYFNFYGTGFVESDKQNAFEIDSGMIHVPKATPAKTYSNVQGHMFTKKEYSWYKVRVDYRFVVGGGTAEVNAGLIVHVDNSKGLLPSKERRPISIEVNMRRPENSPWTLWSSTALGPYITTTIKPGSGDQYLDKAEGGVPWTNDPWGARTVFSSYPNPEKPMGEWNHGEAWVYGDSVGLFYLNGQLRTKGWDFKVRGPDGSADVAKRVPWGKGGIGLQSEMAEVWYKNFEIMELEPHTLRPLNAKTTALADGKARKASKRAGLRTGFGSRKEFAVDGRRQPIGSR